MKYFHEQSWNLKNYVIFLDLDGTVVGEGGTTMHPETKQVFDKLKENNLIVLCSNSSNSKRTEAMAKALDVLWNPGPHKKPSKKILKSIKLPKNNRFAVIGNLHCIDGRFARAIEAEFFAVRTLLGPTEPWTNKVFYWVDSYLFSLLT